MLARSHVDRETVERMRALGVLCDATTDRELLQVYTEIGPGLFFEIVERRGAYDPYGAPNSPVRVAAQRTMLVRSMRTRPATGPQPAAREALISARSDRIVELTRPRAEVVWS